MAKTKKTEAKPGGHLGNNGRLGKPSPKLGKKYAKGKIKRASKIDVQLREQNEPKEYNEPVESLDHEPLSIHYYKEDFIKAWCNAAPTVTKAEDPNVFDALAHTPGEEDDCIFVINEPSCHSIDLRTLNINGTEKSLKSIKRASDRKIRSYHFFMYNSGRWTREELGKMGKGKGNHNASHTCGGTCINHVRPESAANNNRRKKHHAKMKRALENNDVYLYNDLRASCKCEPTCFINPSTWKINVDLLNLPSPSSP